MPLDEALPIAEQIAAALEAAHEKGITHRDLKPGNVKVRPDGVVKVLDFGLAKMGGSAQVTASDNSPTLTMGATQAGMILGTAAYMAPEQAKGKPVDKRADIWAFGVVLYEMVTGRRLFQGEEMVEVLAAVVHGQPDLSGVPERVRRLLAKCLEKDPNKRLRDMSAVRLLLEDGDATVPGCTTSIFPTASPGIPTGPRASARPGTPPTACGGWRPSKVPETPFSSPGPRGPTWPRRSGGRRCTRRRRSRVRPAP